MGKMMLLNYYLHKAIVTTTFLGWHDTKRRLASGELCWVFQEQKTEYSQWEEF